MNNSDPIEQQLRKELELKFNEVLHRMYNLEILPHIQGLINERIPKEYVAQIFVMPDELVEAIDTYAARRAGLGDSAPSPTPTALSNHVDNFNPKKEN